MSERFSHSEKAASRAQIRSRRLNLSPAQHVNFSNRICQHLIAGLSEHNSNSLSAFWPFDGEPDILPSLQSLQSEGQEIALPVIQTEDDTIRMHRWQKDSRMEKNQFGIPEPCEELRVDIDQLDIMLVPLVAWDRQGNRLGMGGGYYDRLMAPLQDAATPRRIGIAFNIQELAAVPVDRQDIPLHGLVTESGWMKFT